MTDNVKKRRRAAPSTLPLWVCLRAFGGPPSKLDDVGRPASIVAMFAGSWDLKKAFRRPGLGHLPWQTCRMRLAIARGNIVAASGPKIAPDQSGRLPSGFCLLVALRPCRASPGPSLLCYRLTLGWQRLDGRFVPFANPTQAQASNPLSQSRSPANARVKSATQPRQSGRIVSYRFRKRATTCWARDRSDPAPGPCSFRNR